VCRPGAGGRDRLRDRRPGGAIGRAGLPELDTTPTRIEPGRVFDRSGPLDEVPAGYRAINDREVIKFMVAF
jgi:hypothetical protein